MKSDEVVEVGEEGTDEVLFRAGGQRNRLLQDVFVVQPFYGAPLKLPLSLG